MAPKFSVNPRGVVLRRTVTDDESGTVTLDVQTETDAFGRPTRTTRNQGGKVKTTEFRDYCLFGPRTVRHSGLTT